MGKWLREDLSFPQYSAKFEENAVDGARLSELVGDDDALRNLVGSNLFDTVQYLKLVSHRGTSRSTWVL